MSASLKAPLVWRRRLGHAFLGSGAHKARRDRQVQGCAPGAKHAIGAVEQARGRRAAVQDVIPFGSYRRLTAALDLVYPFAGDCAQTEKNISHMN